MALTYTTFVNSLVNLMPVPSAGDPGFSTDLPNIIDDAELRIYRDLDLLNTITGDISAAVSTGTRAFNLPSANGTFVVVESINIITPAGTTNPNNGTRNPCVPVSIDYLNFTWGSSNGSTVPQYFAMFSQSTVVFGPWPDQAYQAEVRGTIRPPPLSVSNVTTLLSVYFPDLLLAAAMVRAAAYQKNFGAAVDDPKLAITWEGHFQDLLTKAKIEESRKKMQSQGWSSKEPAPQATPPRT